jgi:hypothetical protein
MTIILYAVVSHLQKGNSSELLKAVEESLKIFQAMDGIAVARRCAEPTQEIFVVAKIPIEAQQRQRIERNNQTPSLAYAVTGVGSSINNPVLVGTGSSNDNTSIPMAQTHLPQPGGDMWGSMDAFSIDASILR